MKSGGVSSDGGGLLITTACWFSERWARGAGLRRMRPLPFPRIEVREQNDRQ